MKVKFERLKEEWSGTRIYRVHTDKEYKDFYCEEEALEYYKEQKTLLGELKRIEDRVERLLEEYPEARKDDWVLYGAYLEDYTGVRKDITFGEIVLEHKGLKLPSFASITRARRKVQARRPDLKDTKTAVKREQAEDDFKEFSKIW